MTRALKGYRVSVSAAEIRNLNEKGPPRSLLKHRYRNGIIVARLKKGQVDKTMAKIICEACGTAFQFELAKDMTICPVCGEPLSGGNAEEPAPAETPDFGDGIVLEENDSFEKDKIDFWWYKVTEPGEEGRYGGVYANCVKCGQATHFPRPDARSGDYLIITDYSCECSYCGHVMKNHILAKRPADWVNPRKSAPAIGMFDNIPTCPVCSSADIRKISLTNKAVSALVLGVLSAGHVSKTYKCQNCGAEF